MLSTSVLYEFKISLFDNVKPDKFLLFIRNFNITLVASGPLEEGKKYQYFCNIVRREALRQFDLLSAEV